MLEDVRVHLENVDSVPEGVPSYQAGDEGGDVNLKEESMRGGSDRSARGQWRIKDRNASMMVTIVIMIVIIMMMI